MRKNFGPKTALYPMPVLIIGSYDENGKPNAMNAAWGGIVDTGLIGICLSEDHRTTKNILKTGAFTVSMADADNVIPADYVGLVSGDKEPEKMEKAGWSCTKSQFVNAPLIDQLPMAIMSAIDGRLSRLEDYIARRDFTRCVEQDMTNGIIAEAFQMDEDDLKRRRAQSVRSVKATNGLISLEKRVRSRQEQDWDDDEWQD